MVLGLFRQDSAGKEFSFGFVEQKLMVNGQPIDLRVSVLPTVYGEKVVLRILDKTSLAKSLSALGFDEVS